MAADRNAPAEARAIERRRWLARHARTVVRLLQMGPPERWADPRFRREVEEVRQGLVPIRSRHALAASFARESALLVRPPGGSPTIEGPVAVAYALRWHELGSGSGPRVGQTDATAA